MFTYNLHIHSLFDNVDAKIILSKIADLTKKQTTSMEEYAEKIAKNAYNYSLNKYDHKIYLNLYF